MPARAPRPLLLLVAALVAAAALWYLAVPGPRAAIAPRGHVTDLQLYREITATVAAGVPYHRAAAEVQRRHHYPLKPFITVREPTLYLAAAWLGWSVLQKLAVALLVANIAAWLAAWPPDFRAAERIAAAMAVAVGGLDVASERLVGFTELWAGLLLALALALRLRRPDCWALPLALVAAALALRELALPYALLSLAFAVWQRRWREVLAWIAVLALFAAGMLLHARAQQAWVLPGDGASPGWEGGQGLRGFLMAVTYTSVLQQLWQPLALVLALLPALGWAALNGPGARFAQLLFAGYAAMLMLFARPDNFYWGFMVLPAWFAGYALVPRAAGQLRRALTSRGSAQAR